MTIHRKHTSSSTPASAASVFRAAGDIRRNVHLDWLEEFTPTAMVEAFRTAGDTVVRSCLRKPWHPDKYLYPVAFLYRHSLELQLKLIGEKACDLLDVKLDAGALQGHDLQRLWRTVRPLLGQIYHGDDPTALIPADQVIAEFHAVDPDGQGFRYYRNRKGQKNLARAPRVINLRHLMRQIGQVAAFLSGCEMGIDAKLDVKAESRASMKDYHDRD